MVGFSFESLRMHLCDKNLKSSRIKIMAIYAFQSLQVIYKYSHPDLYVIHKESRSINKGLLTEREVCTVKYQTEIF